MSDGSAQVREQGEVARPRFVGRRREMILVPLCEAGLLLVAGSAAWVLHQPLFFASLGPTAYELTETPERPSARPYSIIVGHFLGVCAGFLALWVTHASGAPPVTAHSFAMVRVVAAVLAAALTAAGTVLLRATQPAALSTTLLVTTGTMQTPWDGVMIMSSILLITVFGEPLRRWRMAHRQGEAELLTDL